MIPLWEQLRQTVRRHRCKAAALVVLPVLAAAVCTVLLCCIPQCGWKLPAIALIWSIAPCLSYAAVEARLLPLLKTDRLYGALSAKERESVEGICLGMQTGAGMKHGVMMRMITIDSGRRLKNVPAPQEIRVPAIVQLTLPAGERLRLETVDSILFALPQGASAAIRPRDGRYRVSKLVMALLAVFSIIVCGCFFAAAQRKAEPPAVDIAICTPAYHPEAEQALEQAAEQSGLRLTFSYTTTLEPETLFSYLSTYGALDAELLMMPASLYRSVFACDTPVLDPAAFSGTGFLVNEAGQSTALVLFDPSAEYTLFPALTDWIAVPMDDGYVLAVSPSVAAAQCDTVTETLLLLAQCLSAIDFFQ